MGARSLQANSKGLARANIALAQYALNQNALAMDLGLSRQTVNNFFRGKPIDRENFALICDRLGLELESTVATSNSTLSNNHQLDSSGLDTLVEDIRQKVYANIQMRCGAMRVLDMTRPISLDNIYTDVNILQDVTGRRRLDLAELLKSSSLEEFNRLDSFHTRTDRRSGIQVVEEFDKLMLLGKPGAGKTTFLKRLATLCNKGTLQRHRVPVFITLKDFADKSKKPDLLTYIGQWLNEMGVQGAQATEHLLHHGRFFVLLDGLDEVSEVSSKSVLKEIQAFSNRFSQNAFVISCRIAAKEFTFQQFTEAEIADFNNARIADFATRWFQAKQSEEKINLFLGKLEANPPIKELATNPLLLTLLCLVFEGRTDFPSNRSELYKEGIDVLLKKWDGARCIERESVYRNLSLKRKEDLLSQIAFKTFDSGTFFFKQKEAERLIEQYIQNLPDAETDPEILQINSESVLKSIEAQHGLLVEQARGIYSFSHLTFHEYFTSRYILERYELYQHLVRHLTEKRWREIFLLTVGMASKADSLLLLMKDKGDRLLANDEKIKHFIFWLNEKSASVNTPYKPAAVRAFYYSLNLSSVLFLNLPLERVLDLATAYRVEHTSAHDTDLSLISGVDLKLIRDVDYTLAALIRDIDSILVQKIDVRHEVDFSVAHTLIRTLAFDIALSQETGITLKCDLQKIRDELLDLSNKNQKEIKQWWQVNYHDWTERLRNLMIQYRNIGHNWQFGEHQKMLLRQYFDANRLIVDCLNSDCYVSREVREKIENSLFLPHLAVMLSDDAF